MPDGIQMDLCALSCSTSGRILPPIEVVSFEVPQAGS